MEIVLGIVIAGLPLCVVELLTRLSHRKAGLTQRKALAPETSRKLVHTLSACSVLILPLWLSLRQIALIAALFCVLLGATHAIHLWQSLYRIKRQSWGEVAFAAGVLTASLLAHDVRIFLASVAVMGFADTAAALVGNRYGKHRLSLNKKSAEGCLAFFLVALFVLLATGSSIVAALIAATCGTIAEYLTPYGLDNTTVPLVTVILLNAA